MKNNYILLTLMLLFGVSSSSHGACIPLIEEIQQVHAPSIIEASPGNFLVAFYGGKKINNPDSKATNDCSIWLTNFSQQVGEWNTPQQVASGHEVFGESVACWDPVLCKLPSGKIYLFYKIGTDTASWTGYEKSSDDNGFTWSKPSSLAQFGVTGPHKCKPIVTHDALLCAASRASFGFRAGCVERATHDLNFWEVSNLITSDTKKTFLQQPTIFQDLKSNIHLIFRSRNLPCLYTSSYINGECTYPVATNLAGSDSSLDTLTLDDGRVLLAYNDIQGSSRYRLVLMQRENSDCTQWRQVRTIEESHDEKRVFCYPSMIQGLDGLIRLVYIQDYESIRYEIIDPANLIN